MIGGVKIVPALKAFHKSVDKEEKKIYKAVQGTLRKVGFDLKNDLQNDLKFGRFGFDRLSHIRKYQRGKKGGNKGDPLSRLSKGVRYHVASGRKGFYLQVGFVGPTTRSESRMLRKEFGYGITGSQATSKSWIRLAKRHQEGFEQPITDRMRRHFISTGGQIAKRSSGKRKARRGNLRDLKSARFFFLRKDTTHFKTPARPIIEPFWRKHHAEVNAKIPIYFKAKMRGERI